MNKLTTFQIILFVVTIFLIIIGVAVFALKRAGSDSPVAVAIDLWGTLPASLINGYQNKINEANKNTVNFRYRQFSENNFESELISALASGVGPDAVILPDEMLVKHENKIFTIPYDSYPQATFKTTFIEAGDVLLKSNGVAGLPFMIDPLVLYWNRTTLNSNGISNPPQYWDEVLELNPTLTRRDTTGNISKAAIALGEFRNIKNADHILTTLVNQAGNPIIIRNTNDKFRSIFSENMNYSVSPAYAAINFFTQFSNPSKQTYSWNRSLPNSDEMFLLGDLAFYIGLASERANLIQRNPNLNFGVAQLPQSRSSAEDNKRVTGGKLYFLAILNASDSISVALTNIYQLTNSQNMSILEELSELPPVRRDLLSAVSAVDYQDAFNRAALITKPFLDPDPIKTNQILSEAIESVTSGRLSLTEAIRKVHEDFSLVIPQ